MSVISTIRGKCKRCYSCVRNCPVKAIRIKEGQAEVIRERCIACGICTKICAQRAMQIENHIDMTSELLASNKRIIAILSSSFPAAIENASPAQLVTAIRKLGFSDVYEVSFGAQLISNVEYPRLLKERGDNIIITSSCPALVSYIEKYYPSLIKYLAPVVSPMMAVGRMIKNADPSAKTVFIGSCIAKKQEMTDPNVAGLIDAVLTYRELKRMFQASGIDISKQPESVTDGPRPGLARSFSISGGLLKSCNLESDILQSEIIVTEGKHRVMEVLSEVEKGSIKAKFLDLLFCEGCINGPVMDNGLSLFARKDIIAKYVKDNYDPSQTEWDIRKNSSVSLKRGFTSQNIVLSSPAEAEIQDILGRMGRTIKEDELNCGSCGYNTCREKAVAVHQGLAEVEMCLPYLIDELQKTQETLIQAEKMSFLGQIAAGVAHEINNPLTGVLVYIKLLQKNLKEKKVVEQFFAERLITMEKEIERCSRIIKNLLDFSRQTTPNPRMCDLNEKIDSAVMMLTHQAHLANVEIVKNYTENLPPANVDHDQIHQVFINIVLNAIQAMPKGGTLSIKTKFNPGTNELSAVFTDTGSGISREHMKKIFTPFFTTKEKGKGVGLGLAVCYGIIQKHNGRIEVESEENNGTKFTIVLGAPYGKS